MTTNNKPISITTRAGSAASARSPHPVLALPARLVAELPEPMALRLHVPGAPVPVCIWTGAADDRPHVATGLADQIIFDREEFAALVLATEADRLWHADFLGLCFEKWRKPEVDISSVQLFGGANPDPNAVWSLERVFRRLGLQLETVEFDSAPIARPLHAAA